MAGQQLYTDGRAHQADIKYRSDHPSGSVVVECFRGFERTSGDPRRQFVIIVFKWLA